VQVGGNIGNAMSGMVETSTTQTINVVEVSSFQLDAIREFRPHVGVLLNITPDHLDRYSGFAAYRAAKFRMFENQTTSDIAVLNRDDPQVYPPPIRPEPAQRLFSQKIRIGRGAHREGDVIEAEAKGVVDRERAAEAHAADEREFLAALEEQADDLEEILVPAHGDAVLGHAAEASQDALVELLEERPGELIHRQ